MLATLCSNPAATKAVMGKMMARILSVTLRAEIQSQTAKQTSALHMAPSAMAWTKSRLHLALAMPRALAPTAPLAKAYCWLRIMTTAVRIEPAKLPTYTIPQLRSTAVRGIRPLAKAMTIRLLPVNSSAPATTTAMRPRQKTRPPNSLTRPKPMPAADKPVVTIVAKIAPHAIKAPASTARANMVGVLSSALATPTLSMRLAIFAGGNASNCISLDIFCLLVESFAGLLDLPCMVLSRTKSTGRPKRAFYHKP